MKIQRYLRTASVVLTVSVLAASAFRALAAAVSSTVVVKAGQVAPDFTASYLTAPDASGRRQKKEVTLGDFRGEKNVVLAFFPAAFSPGCTSEMAKYQGTSGRFNDTNTVILGISVDSAWANAAFAEQLGVQFNILSDARRDISRAYGVFDEQNVAARRATFVINREGVVQQVFLAQEALDPERALEACLLLKEVK
ncbi:MAG: redoxin domain-containing protein [Nevskiales bacterium]|nr:redoxin domain-containing protein [Nevskiales bacterium]